MSLISRTDLNRRESLKNPVRSLASQTQRQLLTVAFVLLLGFIALVTLFVIYELDIAANGFLRLEAEKLSRAVREESEFVLPNAEALSAYHTWEDIPDQIRGYFSVQKVQPVNPLEIERVNAQGIRQYGYLLYSQADNNTGIYLVSFENADEMDTFVLALLKRALIDSALLALVVFLVLFLLVAWIFKQSMRPLSLLIDWSEALRDNPQNNRPVRFAISELNEISDHLLSGLEQVRAYNEREQHFLKHASHELRTPLAIVQASLDTLKVSIPRDDKKHSTVERALRASNNMIQLSEALLWLARESEKTILRKMMVLSEVCDEVISDHKYLIENKPIELEVTADCTEIMIEEELLRIILSNAVRNAFQYTLTGKIIIRLNASTLEVINDIDEQQNSETTSFGLGLELVKRITSKIGWSFVFDIGDKQARAKVTWSLEEKNSNPK